MIKNILSFLFQFTILAALVTLPARAVTHGDVNGDGEVNIADVNTIINAILSANVSGAADVNGDGEVNIADVNSVINIILNPNPTPPDEGTDPPGLYMGITGFNQQLYTKDISLLNRATKGNFTGFVSSLSTRDATVLYYAVDKSLDALNVAPYPINLRNVALITFTDGLDQGSLMLTDQGYISDTQYASVLSSRIGSMTVHGCPLEAYSIGLKGSDVTNDAMFMSNLQSLASSDDNVALVNNMSEVTAKFQNIADNLAKKSYSYSHTMTLTIPGISDGTRIRFTFDNVNRNTVGQSQQYIEGTFNLASHTLTNVTYHGMTCTSGSIIRPKSINGLFVTYAFEGLILSDPSEKINKNKIQEWYWIADNNSWQINSEFTPSSIDNVKVVASYTSAIVMLVLDCSSSLSSDFETLQTVANRFIETLADYDSYNPDNDTHTYTVAGVSFKMMPVQGGTFTMGATAEQGSDPSNNETPTHEVSLTDFFIGQTEVTQELWLAVMGSNPSYYTGDLKRPVEYVTWVQCQTFIAKLNQLTGENFRLPTEAEWEFAARGGNLSKGYKYSGSNDIGDVAWYTSTSSSKTQPVATKAPNELGLYDMSGNVSEWCQDWYGSYASDTQSIPLGPTLGSYRVLRGGSYYDQATSCRVSCRYSYSPTSRSPYYGLRLAMYDYSSFSSLALSETSLSMAEGESRTVTISGGSGHYTVQNPNTVNAILIGSAITVTAVAPGTAFITVTDEITSEEASIKVVVTSSQQSLTDSIDPGLYMGIMGFNQHLYTKDISLLNPSAKGAFTSFVNSLDTCKGTLLYYAVDKTLDALAAAPCPENLRNVAIVTFTDALDQGSLMVTDRGYTQGTQYAAAIGDRINSMTVHGCPLQAFSIGLKGQDVTDNTMFMSNLRSLASSDDNIALVNNMDEVTEQFKSIASTLVKKSFTYSHSLTLTIPGISNGTRIRFTFDDVNSSSVAQSQRYIEGTFNLSNRSLTDVTYHGMTCSNGAVVMPKSINGVYITYAFDDLILDEPSQQIDKNKIQEWYWVTDYSSWQVNSEFTPSSIDSVEVEATYTSAIVMLVLDCSTSLSSDFKTLQEAANEFITTLANYEDYNPEDPVNPSDGDHEWVDLGLPSGTLWATCNVGTDTPEGYGDYFAWGETVPKDVYNWSTYKWCKSGTYTTITKYCIHSIYDADGFTDDKTILDPEDDAAYVNWGSQWRMPTKAQQDELRENCTWIWTTHNGVNGHMVVGPNENTIFVPAAGYLWNESLSGAGSYGSYWARSLYLDSSSYCAYTLNFRSEYVYRDYNARQYGSTVRAVRVP